MACIDDERSNGLDSRKRAVEPFLRPRLACPPQRNENALAIIGALERQVDLAVILPPKLVGEPRRNLPHLVLRPRREAKRRSRRRSCLADPNRSEINAIGAAVFDVARACPGIQVEEMRTRALSKMPRVAKLPTGGRHLRTRIGYHGLATCAAARDARYEVREAALVVEDGPEDPDANMLIRRERQLAMPP